jgi:hypothetical protein
MPSFVPLDSAHEKGGGGILKIDGDPPSKTKNTPPQISRNLPLIPDRDIATIRVEGEQHDGTETD